MSASVVTIRGRACGRRKNRAEDAETIRLRRLATHSSRVGFEEENVTALALASVMERKLPCNNLRLIAGTLDVRTDFQLHLAELDIARAEREAYEARWRRAYVLNGGFEGRGADAADSAFPDRELYFERDRQATMDLARTPALTRLDLKAKRRAIGSVWLSAEGAWYDQLRAAIAEDEARLEGRRQC